MRPLGSLRSLAEALELIAEREHDRLPLWLPVGLGAGIAAWFVLPDARWWTVFLLIAAALAMAALAFAGGTRWGRALAIFAGVAALGVALIWWKAERVAAPVLERPVVTSFTGRIAQVEPLPARQSVRLTLATASDDIPPKVRVSIPEDRMRDGLRPGAEIALRTRLMPPPPMAVPGAYDFARVAWFQGLGGTGRVIGDVEIVREAPRGAWGDRIAGWRQQLSAHVRESVGEGGAGAIAATLVTGDRGAITDEDAEAMRRSGLAHLLSISGLHVTAVVGAAMLLTLKLLALSPALALRWPLVLVAAGAGAATGVSYTLLTGAEVPTIRSCIAALLVLGGIAMGREALTLRLIAAGALIVLLFWPDALAGPSFQMSFAAVTSIVVLHEHPRVKALLARREEGYAARIARGMLALLLTGIAVELTLTPIALFHFHKSGMYGALANIIAIPLTTFIVMPAEALGLLFDVVGLGAPFWWVAGQGLTFMLWIAHSAANAPGALAMLPSMPPGAFGLIVAGGLWAALWQTRWRLAGFAPIVAGALWAFATPPPDLLVTGDGRHLALRMPDGRFATLRGRAGDYVRGILGEGLGTDGELSALDETRTASCSRDLCVTDIVRDGRRWRLLATRSRDFVAWRDMIRACAEADIVVADRRLPEACAPRWIKADRALLAKTGGLAISLGGRPKVVSVADRVGRHPWRQDGQSSAFTAASSLPATSTK
ncbi:ComEC/Rec2 family competence protein [Allosphingosinicella indica]|uniref:Competence protein ComEC n=1 Tax=Allosphingosinicella indica TaxID=941907 RepID=A0A1X7GWF9_9SPHN|nr:ComEC/Rec2 family competence protein [Allosphingosinicella indica]SMF75811.1 competence protein ComEC [Allosphingosinicella indica]